jgi:hypothetical protein
MDPGTMMMLMQLAMSGGQMAMGGKGKSGGQAPPTPQQKPPTPFQQPSFNLMGSGAPPMQIPSAGMGTTGMPQQDPRLAILRQLLGQQGA